MNGSRRIRFGVSFFFVIIILVSGEILPVSADGAESDGVAKKEENPSIVEIICGMFGKKFPPSSWELIQGAMQKIQTKLYPPNLEYENEHSYTIISGFSSSFVLFLLRQFQKQQRQKQQRGRR